MIKKMHKTSFLLIVFSVVTLACLHDPLVMQGNHSHASIENKKAMSPASLRSNFNKESMTISISQLICREEIRLPLGISPQSDRDIGFASVFLNLENPQEKMRIVVIKNVQIRSTLDDQLQPFTFEQRIVSLNPLEHAVIDIHLSNQAGYGEQHRMTAVVTYEINGQAYVIRSESADVDRL